MMRKLYWYAIVLLMAGGIGSVFAAPTVSQIGGGEYVSGAGGLRGTIATDSGNGPHIATTEAPSTGFYFSDKVGGAFVTTRYNSSTIFNSAQFGGAHMEIDENDTAWISATFWWPNMGVGVVVRPDIKNNPGAYPSFNSEDVWNGPFDVANLSLDPAALGKCYFASHRGVWEEYTYNASAGYIYQSGDGSVDDGAGGEKAFFWIGKAGSVLHADGKEVGVKHHVTEYSYNNSLRAASGMGWYKWSDWNAYPGMLNDHAYPSVVADGKDPMIAYMAAEYYQRAPYGIFLNIWKGTDRFGNGDCLFPSSSLLCLDSNGRTGVGGRYEVQQYPANNGGVWVSWVRGGRAKLRYVPSNCTSINDCGPEVDVCDAGIVMSLCVDSAGDIHLLYNNNGVFYRKLKVSGDSAGSSGMYLPGDYNGDGAIDACVYYPNNGTWYIKYNEGGVFGAETSKAWGWSGAQPVPGDYDGDGTTDFAVYDPSVGTWYIWQSESQTARTQPWGWSGAQAVPADYDGDRKTDVAVYDPSVGTWYIWQSQSWSGRTQPWGWSGAQAVPADYDGDGKADVTVFDPSTGMWYGWLTESQTAMSENWGFAGTKPVPADYDDDNKADMAVYADGTWYVWLSEEGRSATWAWGNSDALPVPACYRAELLRGRRRETRAQVAVYFPELGHWSMKDFNPDDGQSDWTAEFDFGWSAALPPNL
ncbi:MAG: VCBS repeat-containing protein [Kiritimatiellae bacterium]|nr:VCBS repeat-containing protein [Kiritimatiellia bacterium]